MSTFKKKKKYSKIMAKFSNICLYLQKKMLEMDANR